MSGGVALRGVARAVDPAGVVEFGGVVDVRVVVEHADFVAEIEEGNTASRHGDTVREQDPFQGALLAAFEAGERGGGAGDAAVAGAGVVLERDTAGEGARVAVYEEGVEETAVGGAVFAQFGGVGVGEGPAYVVVGADIIDPGATSREIVPTLEGLGDHGGVTRRQRLEVCLLKRKV